MQMLCYIILGATSLYYFYKLLISKLLALSNTMDNNITYIFNLIDQKDQTNKLNSILDSNNKFEIYFEIYQQTINEKLKNLSKEDEYLKDKITELETKLELVAKSKNKKLLF